MFKFILSISIFSLNLFLFGQNFKLEKYQNNSSIEFSFKNESNNFIFKEINGESYIDFTQSHKVTSLKHGKPCLPAFGETFIIPNRGTSTYEITYSSVETIQNVLVAPSKGNLKRNVSPDSIPYFFGEEYSKNEFYPSELVHLNKAFNLRTIRGQVLTLTPYQYNPISKTLKVYKDLKVKIKFNLSEKGENELDKISSNADAISFQKMFLNPIPVVKYNAIEEEGDLLVICDEAYKDSINELIDWKHKKGIKTYLKFTSEFGYTAKEIKNSIAVFYESNPQLKYLLLVGDHEEIPAYSYGTSWDNEELISDSYYGQLIGDDFYPELFVGRFSGTSSQVYTMVKRTLEYEKNPSEGDWMTKALGLGSSEGAGYGDDGQADWQHLRAIRNQLLEFGYTHVHEFYDGSRGQDDADGNPNHTIITPAVNDGVGLFNYTGHGDINACVTGNFSSSHIKNAVNNGKYPFVVSVACNNGTFTMGNCISEAWLRATNENTPSGAIAACGSSILMSWAPPMQTQDEMTNILTESYDDNRKSSLGGLFYNAQMSMLEEYPENGVEVMQTWIMFGDPTTQFRNKLTQDLTVSHVETILPNQSYELNFSSQTEGATVSLTQDSLFLGKSIVVNGTCTINVPELNNFAPISVVATKQNHKIYEGEISVSYLSLTELNKQNVQIFPNPSTDFISFSSTMTSYNVRIIDISGKIVYSEKVEDLNPLKVINIENLSNGFYTLNIENGQNFVHENFVIQK
jgi:gingipain R